MSKLITWPRPARPPPCVLGWPHYCQETCPLRAGREDRRTLYWADSRPTVVLLWNLRVTAWVPSQVLPPSLKKPIKRAKLKVEGKKRRFLLLIIQFIVFSVGILGKRDEIQWAIPPHVCLWGSHVTLKFNWEALPTTVTSLPRLQAHSIWLCGCVTSLRTVWDLFLGYKIPSPQRRAPFSFLGMRCLGEIFISLKSIVSVVW